MMYISAGHNPKGIKVDPGAIGNGYHEADLTIRFRDLVLKELDRLGIKYIKDSDDEKLGTYLERIKTGNGSVVLEFHFDAAASGSATGTTALIQEDADRLDRAFATELVNTTSEVLGIKNRGVISEADSHRGRLGLMREQGIVALLELGFISNAQDLKLYFANEQKLAMRIVQTLIKFEAYV